MKKMLTIIGLAGFAVSAVLAQTTPPPGPPREAPKIDPGNEPRPVKRPAEGQQVAVLEIQLQFDKGKVTEASVRKSTRVDSIAPKVFSRQGGDWEVLINGDEKTSFYVFSPAYLEAEMPERSRQPYTYVARDGAISWPLVIPLYRGQNKINAESIVIRDRRSRAVILEAGL